MFDLCLFLVKTVDSNIEMKNLVYKAELLDEDKHGIIKRFLQRNLQNWQYC